MSQNKERKINMSFDDAELVELDAAKELLGTINYPETIKSLISIGKVQQRFFTFDSVRNKKEIKDIIRRMEKKWLS
jgi:hypothetical protein